MSQPARPPASIKVLGILNLVFAGLGAFGTLFTWASYFGHLDLGHRNPVIEIAHESPAYMRFLEWSIVATFVGLVVLLASGIGLLKLRMWGRKLAIVYAVFTVIAGIVAMVMTQHYLLEPLSHSHSPAAIGGAAGGYMGALAGLAYPVVLLAFMFRRNVVAALVAASEPPVPPARVV